MSVTDGSTGATPVVVDKSYNTGTRYGVLLVTDGAPERLTARHVWRFLSSSLSNPRLIDVLPMWMWRPLLYAYVIPWRLAETIESYRHAWITAPVQPSRSVSATANETSTTSAAETHVAGDGVAAAVCTARVLGRRLERRMRERLRGSSVAAAADVSVQVEVGFCHSAQSICAALERMLLCGNYGAGARDTAGEPIRTHTEHLLILPLYPHYTSLRSATAWDAVMQCGYFQRQQSIPNVHFIRSYSQHAAFVAAWQRHLRRFIGLHGKPDWLFLVFETVPTRLTQFGDTCVRDYTRTVEQLREALSVPKESAGSPLACGSDCETYFTDALDPSRVVLGYLGKGGEPALEPRIDKLLARILVQLRHHVARSSEAATSTACELSSSSAAAGLDNASVVSSSSSRVILPEATAPTAYIACPGIAVDDVNTLSTIQQRLCQKYVRLGWKQVRYIPALNDGATHVEMLAAVVTSHMRNR
ncbi:Ferrochelatase [Novymonas esmeraldas]|uniref:Ferrochelatase n=1 Tax=Novymonas esmeraldas TaxID=1808958 RepID=A0AAW0F1U7_9TRYP